METSPSAARPAVNTLDIVYIALFAVLIAVCSWISIPLQVPFTLQTFAVFLTCGLLGGKRGTLSVIVYLLLAAVGVPVLAGFKGGLGSLLGPTGGYLLGFVFIGLIMWALEKPAKTSVPVLVLSMVLGLAVCYAFGTAWFMVVYAKNSGPVGLSTALGWCVIPFLIPDAAKIALATVLTKALRRYVK